jgi:membrane protein
MTVSLVLLVATSFITSAILRLIAAFLISQPSIWVTIGIWFLPLGLDVVLFGLVFRYVPARNVHWDAVWSAAMVGAIGLELSKVAFEWYLANLASYTLVYGGLAAGIILLFWAFLIASIFLFSAELCAQLNRWLIVQHEERRHKRIEISLQGGQIRVEAPDERPKYLP